MDPPTQGAPGRDALIGMIRAQLEEDGSDQDARRDAFLCLAVTVPRRQRARARAAMGPLLTRARIKGSDRDSAPEDADHHHRGHLHHHNNNGDMGGLAAELEARIGVLSTLLVLGCEYMPIQSSSNSAIRLLDYFHYSVLFVCGTLPMYRHYLGTGTPLGHARPN